jgi:cellulose synthase/poly-beta-1,6-N-acetylglucosamine synthase-like glycosyltransferase
MHDFLELSNRTLFLYYLLSNCIYLVLLVVAIVASARHQQQLSSIRLERVRVSPLAPPISLLVPAHNEERTIAESVRSLVALDYPELEVIVVNDGSSDRTLQVLKDEFQLLATDLLYVQEVPSKPVRGIYMSQIEPRLLVVDKEAGGCKADAINAALNAASSPYVCVVDADSILEKDALLRIMVPILSDPRRVIAAGGIVRVLNGSRVAEGTLKEVRLPKRPIEIIQVVEYLRAFLIGREGWAHFNMLPIISGAFGIFRRDLVRAVGGFRPEAIGEDVDLVVRLHRHMLEQKQDYLIAYVPDPVCWTEVPADTSSLRKQRGRWQKGLLDTLWQNRDMLCNPRYGRFGTLSLPHLWLFELLAPIVECFGYFTITLAFALDMISREFFIQFLIFGYIFATMISIGSVLLEEITFKRYNHPWDVVRLLFFCLFEHIPYRQFHMLWRLEGIWQFFRGDIHWGQMVRAGFPPQKAKAKSGPQLL